MAPGAARRCQPAGGILKQVLSAGRFFAAWRALGFRADPPNAVLMAPGRRGRARAVAVELGTPRWNARKRTVTFRVRVLRRATGGLAHLDRDLRGGVPARLRGVALFIDDALPGAAPGQCDLAGTLDLFPSHYRLSSAYLPADGQLLPAIRYQALFALISTIFGGDGATFATPRVAAPDHMGYGICVQGPTPSTGYEAPECTVGTISLQAQPFTASGWIPADGRTLQIQSEQQLYDTIRSTFGGDGTTTFGVPQIVPPGGEESGLQYYICADGTYVFPGGQTADWCILSQLTLFATGFIPTNYLPADGRTLQVSNQQPLYQLLGNDFGGDGRTTFALPDLPGPVPGTSWGVCVRGTWPT